tara:strand:+ start:87 stop:593 length:507 start_codon:yes stop_codon:yes gene_type:complete
LIKELKNPKTDNYLELKRIALSEMLPVQYMSTGTGLMYYCHTVITRPETYYFSTVASPHCDLFAMVIQEILTANKVLKKGFFITRAAINIVHSNQVNQFSDKHVDHDFPHTNIIVYLTDEGGRTFCGKKEHDPQEDDVILMKGEHYHETPKQNRRVVFVATFIGELSF